MESREEDASGPARPGPTSAAADEKVTFPMRPRKKRFLVRKSPGPRADRSAADQRKDTRLPTDNPTAATQQSSLLPQGGLLDQSGEQSTTILHGNQVGAQQHDSPATHPRPTSPQSGGDSASPSPAQRKRVCVAKTICASELHVESAPVGDSALPQQIVYNSVYGRFISPTHAKSAPRANASRPRLLPGGTPVPYTILGPVDDYLRLLEEEGNGPGRKPKSPPRSPERLGRRSSKMLNQLRKSRSSIFSSQQSTSNSSHVPPTAASVCSEMTDEEYLGKVLDAARAEATKRAAAAQPKLEAERKERMSRLLAHEQLMYDRQERALNLYEQWQEEWARFRSAMARMTGKSEEQLVVSRGEGFRRRLEEYNYINEATPHHEKHGSEYWMMSLRGMGTRYVAVGNIFSGLFCPVREESNLEMETIRVPPHQRLASSSLLAARRETEQKEVSGQVNGASCKSSLHQSSSALVDSKTLKRRKAQLAASLAVIRPHEMTAQDAEQLVIQGEPLVEWAFVSAEQRALAGPDHTSSQKSMPEPVTVTIEMDPAETSESDFSERSGPSLQLEFESAGLGTAGQPAENQSSAVASLSTVVGQCASIAAVMTNTGTTALYCSWELSSSEPAPQGGNVQRLKFLCLAPDEVVLPGETKRAVFVFKSLEAGAWTECWRLNTSPAVSESARMQVELRGIAFQQEVTATSCLEAALALEGAATLLRAEWDHQQEQLVALDAKPSTISLAHTATKLEAANQPLGLFFSPAVASQIVDLAQRIFAELHTYDIAASPEEVQTAIKCQMEDWLQTPSLVLLRKAISQLSSGLPLCPPNRDLTVASADDYTLDGLGELNIDPDGASVALSGFGPVGGAIGELATEGDAGTVDGTTQDGGESDDQKAEASEADKAVQEQDQDALLKSLSIDEKDYLECEQFRLAQIAAELDAELMRIAQVATRSPEERSAVWPLARAFVGSLADAVVEAFTPARDGDDQDIETAEYSALSPTSDRRESAVEEAAVSPIDHVLQHAIQAASALASACYDLEEQRRQKQTAIGSLFSFHHTQVMASKLALERAEASNSINNEQVSGKGLFFKKRVVLFVDLELPRNATSAQEEDATTRLVQEITKTVDWVAKFGPRSIVLAGSRLSGATFLPISEELATGLGREVTFIEDLEQFVEDQAAASEEERSEANQAEAIPPAEAKKKQPAGKGAPAIAEPTIDVDDIPVLMLNNVAAIKAANQLASFNEAIGFATTVVVDSFACIADTSFEVSIAPSQQVVIGPGLEKTLVQTENLLETRHVYIVGDAPLLYPKSEREDEEDEHSGAEQEASAEAAEDSGSEAESVVYAAATGKGGHPNPPSREAGEADGDQAVEVESSEDHPASQPPDAITQGSYGFSDQIAVLTNLVRAGLAKRILLCGPLARALSRSVLVMGKAAQRLLAPSSHGDLTIPDDPSEVCIDLPTKTPRQAEQSTLREWLALARSHRVQVQLLDLDPSMPSEQLKSLIESHLPSHDPVALIGGLEQSYLTRLLLRVLGGKVKSGHVQSLTLTGAIALDGLSLLLSGDADAEVEQELAAETERANQAASAQATSNSDEAIANELEAEGKTEVNADEPGDRAEADEEDLDTFGLLNSKVHRVLNQNCLMRVLAGEHLFLDRIQHKPIGHDSGSGTASKHNE